MRHLSTNYRLAHGLPEVSQVTISENAFSPGSMGSAIFGAGSVRSVAMAVRAFVAMAVRALVATAASKIKNYRT